MIDWLTILYAYEEERGTYQILVDYLFKSKTSIVYTIHGIGHGLSLYLLINHTHSMIL